MTQCGFCLGSNYSFHKEKAKPAEPITPVVSKVQNSESYTDWVMWELLIIFELGMLHNWSQSHKNSYNKII